MPFEMKWVIDRSNKAENDAKITQKLRKNQRGKNEVKMRCKFKSIELEEVK